MPAEVINELVSQSARLREIDLSIIANPDIRATADQLVNSAINQGFSSLMWINAAIGLSSLALLIIYHWRFSTKESTFWSAR